LYIWWRSFSSDSPSGRYIAAHRLLGVNATVSIAVITRLLRTAFLQPTNLQRRPTDLVWPSVGSNESVIQQHYAWTVQLTAYLNMVILSADICHHVQRDYSGADS